jgi:hypothetical protein
LYSLQGLDFYPLLDRLLDAHAHVPMSYG